MFINSWRDNNNNNNNSNCSTDNCVSLRPYLCYKPCLELLMIAAIGSSFDQAKLPFSNHNSFLRPNFP